MAVTVVIPAYNEEATVGKVVVAARAASLVREVIVVDDGSSDGTATAAEQAGARVITLGANAGKAQALWAGAEAAEQEVLLFLDADLLGLKPEHVQCLAQPVLAGHGDMAIGVFRRGRLATDMAHYLAPRLSGQRALLRRHFFGAKDYFRPGFGAEVALNAYAKRRGLVVVRVPLEGVSHLTKEEKRGLVRGLAARLCMYLEIWRALD